MVVFDFLGFLMSDRLLDRHEVQSGREGKCQKKKGEAKKATEADLFTGRIVCFFSR